MRNQGEFGTNCSAVKSTPKYR